MRKARLLTTVILFSLLLLAFVSCVTGAKESKAAVESGEINGDDDDAVEVNPDFVEPGDDDGSDSSSDEDDEEDEDVAVSNDNSDDSVKSKIDAALVKSKRTYKKSLKFVTKNRTKITVALTLFAFRREIRQFLMHLVTNEIRNPKTGKLRISPTSILKFILFVDFMRRLQSGRNASQPGFQALVNLGEANPFMGVLFSRVLRVPMFNPAFVPPISQHYTFERINERYVKDAMALHKAIHAKHEGFKWPLAEVAISQSMIAGNRLPESPESNETVVVVDMTNLDTSVSTMDQIRDQVSFLVSQYRAAAMMEVSAEDANATDDVPKVAHLEVVLLLQSPGGSAADYGLAADQLLRLRKEPGITLTICVDKVAASGGYMMACTASPGRLFAAPFAVVGSIGVLGQIVNAQKLLEGWGLSPMVFRGGKDKAPLGLIGEVTQDGKDKTQADIDTIHEAFQQHVVDARPVLKKNIKKVGTGDIFIGKVALNLGLIDKITTSDEYITRKVAEGARVLKLVKNRKARFPFGANFDNYDTTLGVRQPLSIPKMLSSAWKSTSEYLGVDTDVTQNSLRQAVSLVERPKAQVS